MNGQQRLALELFQKALELLEQNGIKVSEAVGCVGVVAEDWQFYSDDEVLRPSDVMHHLFE